MNCRRGIVVLLALGACTDVVHLTLDAPDQPAAVEASAFYRGVRLDWSPNVSDDVSITSYSVYGAASSATTWSAALPGAFVATGVQCCSFQQTDLTNEEQYWFTVTAWHGSMESPHSEIVSAKPPGWPGTRQFGTAGVDATPAVSIGTFGAVTLAGLQSEVDNVAERDVLVLRVDANGAVRWTRSFGSPNSTDAASGVVPLGDGSAIVAGSTLGSLDGTNAGLSDIFLARLDATGTRTWTRQIGTTGSDYGSDIAVDSDGYVYVAGETNGDLDGNTTAGGADAFHTKYDTNGTKISTWQAGGTGVDSASAIAIDSGKNRYLAGRTFSDLHGNVNAGGADVFVSKYNSAGARLWTRQIGTTADDWANDIAVDGGGRVVAVGRSATAFDGKSPQGGIDAIAVCYSAAGVKLWSAQFGSAMNDEAFAVAADRNNNFIVVGYTLGDLAASSAGAQDLFIAKLSSAGLVIWTRQFGTAGDDIAQAVATDPETSMAYVSGTTSEGFDGNAGLGSADSFLIKIGPDGTKQ